MDTENFFEAIDQVLKEFFPIISFMAMDAICGMMADLIKENENLTQ